MVYNEIVTWTAFAILAMFFFKILNMDLTLPSNNVKQTAILVTPGFPIRLKALISQMSGGRRKRTPVA